MRILFVNTLYYPNEVGGAERSVRIMAEYLAGQGHDVFVLSIHHENELELKTVDGVRVFYLPSQNLFYPHENGEVPSWAKRVPVKVVWHLLNSYDPRMARKVRRILKTAEPDVVHTNNLTGLSTSVWTEVQSQHIPLVHTLRDYYLLCHRSTMYRNQKNCPSQCWHCKPFAAIRQRLARSVDAVVGISQFVLDAHRKRGGFAKTPIQAVIPNPYAGGSVNPKHVEHQSKQPLQAGFLGRLAPSKGMGVLMEAAESVPSDLLHVHIGGRGKDDYVGTLKKRHSTTNVTFHGYVDPSTFLPSLDVLVVPSLWREPLGRVVFEAFAHGVPVIGANRGGIPEMIDEGTTGYVFDPSDVDSLRALLVQLARSPSLLQPMRDAAYEESRRYRPETVMSEYLEVYTRLRASIPEST